MKDLQGKDRKTFEELLFGHGGALGLAVDRFPNPHICFYICVYIYREECY